jgi:hypothetical protein
MRSAKRGAKIDKPKSVNPVQYILIVVVRLYRWALSPAMTFLFGPLAGCRFTPSCSAYALQAIQRHGALAGGWLAMKRLGRCHPWGDCGSDPVPPLNFKYQISNIKSAQHGS